jgi:hypothetical protein
METGQTQNKTPLATKPAGVFFSKKQIAFEITKPTQNATD